MKEKSNKTVVLFSIFFSFVFLFMLFCFGVVIMYIQLGKREKPFFDVKKYQMLVLNPKTKYLSFGHSTETPWINSEGYKFYQNKIGDYVLLSELGDDEYQCSGTCLCDDGERRYVATARTLTSGLFYLAAAVSSMFILQNQAKEYFTSECRKLHSDSCEVDRIFADVEDCERLTMRHQGHDHSHDDLDKLFDEYVHSREHIKIKEGEYRNKKRKGFECEGKCLRHQQAPLEGKKVVCGLFGVSGFHVNVPIDHFTEHKGLKHVAEAKFVAHHLREYCENIKHPDDPRSSALNYCVATIHGGMNPSVKCEENAIQENLTD